MRTFEFHMNEYDSSSGLMHNERVHHEFSEEDFTVDDMLERFKKFLQACGYVFNLENTIEVIHNE